MFSGCRTDESKVRGSPRQNPEKFSAKECGANTNAPAEKRELIKREFEELGSTSREYETYTHPKPGPSERKIARCNRRLCFRMEKELSELKSLAKDEHIIASAAGRGGDSLKKMK